MEEERGPQQEFPHSNNKSSRRKIIKDEIDKRQIVKDQIKWGA